MWELLRVISLSLEQLREIYAFLRHESIAARVLGSAIDLLLVFGLLASRVFFTNYLSREMQ